MARGRKAKAECSKCETIMTIGEAVDERIVRMVCSNCDFTKTVMLEKVPDICRKPVIDAAIPDVNEETRAAADLNEERVEITV